MMSFYSSCLAFWLLDVAVAGGSGRGGSHRPIRCEQRSCDLPRSSRVVPSNPGAWQSWVDEKRASIPAPTVSSRSNGNGILIGGAGMAGLGLAQTLEENGVDSYQLLEAADRVGGRAYSLMGFAGSYVLEYGANWCHGGSESPFVEFCQNTLGLGGYDDNFDNVYLYNSDGTYSGANTEFEDGSECSNMDNAWTDFSRMVETCIVPGSETTLSGADATFCNDVLGFSQPLNGDDYTREEAFENVGYQDTVQADPAMGRLCEFYYHDWDYAAKPALTGTAFSLEHLFGVYKDFFVRDDRGMKAIPEAIAASILDVSFATDGTITGTDDKLKLSTQVLQVSWDPDGNEDASVLVCTTNKVTNANTHDRHPCADGGVFTQTLQGTAFVSTFSLGVLKKTLELERSGATLESSYDVAPRFDPPLSNYADIVAFIDGNTMGVYNKVFLKFQHAFWDDDVRYILSGASEGAFVGDFAPVWSNYNFEAYPDSNILGLTVTGDRAIDLEGKDNSVIIDEILPKLNAMYSSSINAAYGKTEVDNGDVMDFAIAKWSTDPLFYASYSTNGEGVYPDLYAKSTQRYGNLFFAGEATCELHHASLYGAQWSGEAAGLKILGDIYGQTVDPRTLCTSTPEELAMPYSPPGGGGNGNSCFLDFIPFIGSWICWLIQFVTDAFNSVSGFLPF